MKRFLMLFLGLSLVLGLVAIAEDFELIPDIPQEKQSQGAGVSSIEGTKKIVVEEVKPAMGRDGAPPKTYQMKKTQKNEIQIDETQFKVRLQNTLKDLAQRALVPVMQNKRTVVFNEGEIEIEIVFEDVVSSGTYPKGKFDLYAWSTKQKIDQVNGFASPYLVYIGKGLDPFQQPVRKFKMAEDVPGGPGKGDYVSFIKGMIGDNSQMDFDNRIGIIRLIAKQTDPALMKLDAEGIVNYYNNTYTISGAAIEQGQFYAEPTMTYITQTFKIAPLIIQQSKRILYDTNM